MRNVVYIVVIANKLSYLSSSRLMGLLRTIIDQKIFLALKVTSVYLMLVHFKRHDGPLSIGFVRSNQACTALAHGAVILFVLKEQRSPLIALLSAVL